LRTAMLGAAAGTAARFGRGIALEAGQTTRAAGAPPAIIDWNAHGVGPSVAAPAAGCRLVRPRLAPSPHGRSRRAASGALVGRRRLRRHPVARRRAADLARAERQRRRGGQEVSGALL